MRLTGRSHRPLSPPAEPVFKADDRLPLRVATRDLDRILDRFRTGIHKYGFLRPLARHQRVQPLANGNIAFVRQYVEAGMQEAIQLAAHRFDNSRSPMSGVEASDAPGKINQPVTVNIFDHGSFRPRNEDWRGMISRLHPCSISPPHQGMRPRSGNSCTQLNGGHKLVLS